MPLADRNATPLLIKGIRRCLEVVVISKELVIVITYWLFIWITFSVLYFENKIEMRDIDCVCVTLDGNSFIPLKSCSKRFLPIYYTVIAWDGTDVFKHMLARKYFIVGITVALFFALNCFRIAFLNAQNWTILETACNYFVNPTFSILRLNVRR